MTNCEYCGGSGDVHTIDGEWRGECPVCPQAPTMTPGEREELARAMPSKAPIGETLDALAPIIERVVAERVAAETERCAKVAESFEPKSYIKDWRDGCETARNYIAFAIRSTTR